MQSSGSGDPQKLLSCLSGVKAQPVRSVSKRRGAFHLPREKRTGGGGMGPDYDLNLNSSGLGGVGCEHFCLCTAAKPDRLGPLREGAARFLSFFQKYGDLKVWKSKL